VRFFRREEPLHIRLAREAGVDLNGEPAVEDSPPDPPGETGSLWWDAAAPEERTAPSPWRDGYGGGSVGLPRFPEWDAVATATVELAGSRAVFVALPSGDLVIEEGPDSVQPLADAIESELGPPYRAEAVRRGENLWAIGARRIEVVTLPGIHGDEIELTNRDGHRTLVVDGERSFGSIPALERPDTVCRASRIDGDVWEVTFGAL
jgi:hypothetical protein